MSLKRTIVMALGISLASGALATTASAEPGWDRDGRDGQGWRDGDRGDRGDRWDRGDRGDRGDRWDRGDHGDHRHDWGPGERWRRWVSVGVFNSRHRPVKLFLNGRFLGRIPAHSFEQIRMPRGYHVISYQVGRRGGWHTLGVRANRWGHNHVVIPSRRGYGGGYWRY